MLSRKDVETVLAQTRQSTDVGKREEIEGVLVDKVLRQYEQLQWASSKELYWSQVSDACQIERDDIATDINYFYTVISQWERLVFGGVLSEAGNTVQDQRFSNRLMGIDTCEEVVAYVDQLLRDHAASLSAEGALNPPLSFAHSIARVGGSPLSNGSTVDVTTSDVDTSVNFGFS